MGSKKRHNRRISCRFYAEKYRYFLACHCQIEAGAKARKQKFVRDFNMMFADIDPYVCRSKNLFRVLDLSA